MSSGGDDALVTPEESEGWRRIIVVTVAIASLAMTAQSLVEAPGGGPGGLALGATGTSSPIYLGLLLAVVLAGLWTFRRHGHLLGALLALLGLMGLCHTYAAVHGTSGTGYFQPGAALLGWLWGATLLRRSNGRLSPTAPAMLALAAFTATYTVSGISKLMASGWAWSHPDQIRLVILSTAWQPFATTGWNASLQRVIVDSPALAQTIATGVLLLELGAPLALLGRSVRTFVLVSLLCMHLGIAMLMEHVFFPAMLLCAVMGIPVVARALAGGRELGRRAPESAVGPVAPRRGLGRAGLAMLSLAPLGILGVLAASGLEPKIDRGRLAAGPREVRVGAAAEAFGPLRLGQEFVGGWRIDRIDLGDAIAAVRFADPSRATITLTLCQGPSCQPAGAFDRDGLAVAYMSQPAQDFDAVIEPLGRAVMELLDVAAEGDPAARFRSWLH